MPAYVWMLTTLQGKIQYTPVPTIVPKVINLDSPVNTSHTIISAAPNSTSMDSIAPSVINIKSTATVTIDLDSIAPTLITNF